MSGRRALPAALPVIWALLALGPAPAAPAPAAPGGVPDSIRVLVAATAAARGHILSGGRERAGTEGGIARRETALARLAGATPTHLIVDGGDIADPGRTGTPWAGRFLVAAMDGMNYDAVTPGESDLSLGAERLARLYRRAPQVRVVSANVTGRDGKILFAPSLIMKKAGVRFAVTGVTDPGLCAPGPGKSLQGFGDFRVGDPDSALAAVLPELRRDADLVVVIAHVSPGRAASLAARLPDLVDVMVVGHEPGAGGAASTSAGVTRLAPGDLGTAVAVARLEPAEGGTRWSTRTEILPLDAHVPEASDLAARAAEAVRGIPRHIREEAAWQQTALEGLGLIYPFELASFGVSRDGTTRNGKLVDRTGKSVRFRWSTASEGVVSVFVAPPVPAPPPDGLYPAGSPGARALAAALHLVADDFVEPETQAGLVSAFDDTARAAAFRDMTVDEIQAVGGLSLALRIETPPPPDGK